MAPATRADARELRVILVTGATGNIGGAVVSRLSSGGQRVRALVHTTPRADDLRGYDCEIAVGDYRDEGAMRAALHGVERLLLVAPLTEDLAERELAVLQAVQDAAPGAHVAKIAVAGVDTDRPSRILDQHRRVVRYLRDTGLPVTVLAPTSFMQNLLRAAGTVQEQGVLAFPAGSARISHVDVRDVAAVAAHVLTSDGHDGATYTITGPQALTYDEVAAALSRVLGRQVRYVDVPPEQAGEAMRASGQPDWNVTALLELYASYREGAGDLVTEQVRRATGQPARTLEQFLVEHQAAFR